MAEIDASGCEAGFAILPRMRSARRAVRVTAVRPQRLGKRRSTQFGETRTLFAQVRPSVDAGEAADVGIPRHDWPAYGVSERPCGDEPSALLRSDAGRLGHPPQSSVLEAAFREPRT